MSRVAGLIVLGLVTSVAGAQPAAFSRPTTIEPGPRLERALSRQIPAAQGPSFLRVVGQMLGGTLGSWLGGYLGYVALADSDQRHDTGVSVNGNTGYAIGALVGSAAAIHAIGRGDGSRSPVLATALAAAIPTVPLLMVRDDEYMPVYGVVFAAPAQAILGTLGYHVGRQLRSRSEARPLPP